MKNSKALLAVLVCGTMFFGCKKDEAKAPAEPAAAVEATKTAEATAEAVAKDDTAMPEAGEQAPFAVMVQHKVKDFDKWLVKFDEHLTHRKGAGVLGHHISRNADDENMVSVYFPMATTEKFMEMLKSEDMKKAMTEAGVEGEPVVHVMKPVEGKPVLDRDIPGAVIVHEVEDFAKWKTAFDSHAEARTKAGIIGYAVNQIADKETTIVVLLQAEKAEELTAFMASEDLKTAMAEAGVKGKPAVTMINSSAGAMY